MKHFIAGNGFGPFYCAGHEILRRVFVTVRDRHWREIAPSEWHCHTDQTTRTIAVTSLHVSEQVDFAWRGTLCVSADERSVHFAFSGEARRTMDVCRLGLVVLHPVDAMLGAHVTAEGSNGKEQSMVSPIISPQPIIEGLPAAMLEPFTSLVIERADIGLLELQFAGDLFELEDQRNWGDASFKTYCTPLSAGFPRQIPAGTRVAHRMELRYTPSTADRVTRSRLPIEARRVFPRVGRMRAAAGPPKRIGLRWHHLNVEVAHPYDVEALRSIFEEECGLSVEFGVEDCLHDQFSELVASMANYRQRIARLLLYGAGTSPPSEASLMNWRRALDAAGASELALFAATRGYFVEFNRSLAVPGVSVEGLSFPLTATVHSDDALTIAENVSTICDMADTARHRVRSTGLALVPLALYYPTIPALRQFPALMRAPWLAATLMHAATAGVTSVTLANDVADSTPIWLIDRLLGCADTASSLLPDEQPNGIHAMLCLYPERKTAQILAANLNPTPARLVFNSLGTRLRSLVAFQDGLSINISGTSVEMGAFAVCWLECELM